jgi:branched-chain amino acid transport system ATP-binding protein
MSAALTIRDISKSFGGFRALDGVSLTIEPGSLFGIIGPNGAGKSTLFSVISGFMAQDSGHVSLGATALDRLSPPARALAGMVRTFQVPREFSHLTVRENLMASAPGQAGEGLVSLFFRPGRVRADEARISAKAAEVMAFLTLDRVAELGRALMVEPRLILLDEPFAGVNPVLVGTLGERIAELNRQGIGFLIIEHDLGALTRLVPHLAVMDRGQVIAQGEPNAVLDDPAVREAYLGGAS